MNGLMDIINEKDEVVGQESLQNILKKGFLHRAVHIFIIRSDGKLFCRQRNLKKQIYPGYWSTSVGAHVFSGQSYDEVAAEFLKKHLGISCELKMVGKARVKDSFENEISATYIGYSDEEMKFEKEEIEGGKFLTIDEIKELGKRKDSTPDLGHSLEVYLKHIKG